MGEGGVGREGRGRGGGVGLEGGKGFGREGRGRDGRRELEEKGRVGRVGREGRKGKIGRKGCKRGLGIREKGWGKSEGSLIRGFRRMRRR